MSKVGNSGLAPKSLKLVKGILWVIIDDGSKVLVEGRHPLVQDFMTQLHFIALTSSFGPAGAILMKDFADNHSRNQSFERPSRCADSQFVTIVLLCFEHNIFWI